MNRLERLRSRGVSIWLDTLSRELLESGGFDLLTSAYSVTGATSNPTIFAKAICGSDRYDEQLADLRSAGVDDLRELFFEAALADVREAAARLRPVHERTRGADGYVSFEVTPDVAQDTEATIGQAMKLWRRLDAPNVMIKVPATTEGVDAIEALTAAGVNVNVTLLFSVERYGQVVEAYLRGLERRAEAGEPLAAVRSVASFFVSRVDAKADARLPADSPLRGGTGIANALAAYRHHLGVLATPRWRRLAGLGGSPQRPLWASTAPKNPVYRDVMYLERLALPGTILTVPEATLRAFADHGEEPNGDVDPMAPELDLTDIAAELEREGVDAFRDSYDELLDCIGAHG